MYSLVCTVSACTRYIPVSRSLITPVDSAAPTGLVTFTSAVGAIFLSSTIFMASSAICAHSSAVVVLLTFSSPRPAKSVYFAVSYTASSVMSATLYTSTGISRSRSSSNSVSSNVNVREHFLSVSTPRAPYTLDKPAADKTVIAARVSAPAVFILFFIVTSIPPSTYHPSYRNVSYSSGQTGTS